VNWAKAKTILILSFLMLDVLLATQVWRMLAQPLTTDPYSDFNLEQLEMLLAQNGIRLSASLPTESVKKPLINVRYRNTEVLTLNPGIPVDQVKRNNLAELIPAIRGTVYDPVKSTRNTAVFNRLAEELPLFRVNIILRSAKNVWQSAEIQSATVMSKGTPQPLISSFLAVRSAYDRHLLEAGDEVVDVRLGYEGQAFTSDMQVMAPTWRIALASGRDLYVHAVTGAVLNNDVAENKSITDNR
jgi:regulatory protein YycI of two-component signal transduction system YycFG